jgi:nitrogen fixation/metabolism regulation signal transduction histidine kinase
VGLDLVRSTTAADRALAQFIDGVAAEGNERPIPHRGLRRATDAIQRTLAKLAAARADRQRRIDHLEALTDNVAAALLVLDGEGRIVTANRAARQGLGATAGPLAAVAAFGPMTAVRLRGLAPGAREIVRLADGRAMLASAAAFEAEGARLTLVSLQSVSGELDIVELKAWQDLVRVLAHEMMNSMTPICSLSESLGARLRAGADPAAIAEDVEVIARRSAGLMHFVERYRRLTDLPEPERTKVRAADLAGNLDRLMGPMMAEAGVDYASAVAPKSLALDADPELLEQALINLLKNALEAVRGRDGAAVRLGVRLEEGVAALIVEDNGPGLPSGDPDAVFVPFFTTKEGGSGVGLTLARQIALAHGGRLEHSPRPGGGAAFRLLLPYG